MTSKQSTSVGADPAAGRTSVHPKEYRVTRIEKIPSPDGGPDNDWYQYVIEAGRSTITGCRRGSRAQVAEHAQRYAEEANARSVDGGAGHWAPRRRS
jgi:hypothetical protein